MASLFVILFLVCSAFNRISNVNALDCSALADGRDTTTKVPCLILNPNATSCGKIGCCWNAVAPKLKCFTVAGGRCVRYQGKSCRSYLNTTLLPYRETPRFIDNKLGLRTTEMFLREMIGIINQYAADDKYCQKVLLTMVCHYTLPPCKSNGKIRPFCREDCLEIFDRCKASLNQAVGAAKYYSKSKNIDFSHLSFPNCSHYKSSTSYDMLSNDSCVQTGMFNYKKQPDKGTNILPIVLPIFFILIIIIFVAVVFVVVRHRKIEKARAMNNSKLMLSEGALTMREKLRADSLKSLNSGIMRLYDPSKVKHFALDNVEYLKDLGEGHFGKVFQGRTVGIVDGQPKREVLVAVKALKEGSSKELKEEFYNEVALMSIFDHPNIVSLIAVSTEEEPYGMIFEYMSEGDLNHYMRNAKLAEDSLQAGPLEAKAFLSQEDLVRISEQIAAGMEQVAKLRFIHRDLATRNCLVGPNLLVKIADFGMSRDIYDSNYYKMSRETLLPIRWLAPEAFLYGKFTSMSDVYSYGVVLWEIYTFGLQPYYGYTNTEVTTFIKEGVLLGKPDLCPNYIYSVMKDCWTKESSDRPGFDLIQKRLRDPYGNYDKPKDTSVPDSVDGQADTGSQGNYDVPKSAGAGDVDLSQNYDTPKSPDHSKEELSQNYDTPKSPDHGKEDSSQNYDIPKSPVHDEEELQDDDEAKLYPGGPKKPFALYTQSSVEV